MSKIKAIFGIAVMAAILLGGLTFSQSAFAGVSTGGGPGGGPGGGQQKVTLCHVDQETGEEITITVGAPAVPAHLAHGDTLGACVDEPSGCIVNEECSLGEVCIHPIGEDPLAPNGVCGEPPGICLLILEPVCGVDGITYTNSCVAAANGVNIAHVGVCNSDIP